MHEDRNLKVLHFWHEGWNFLLKHKFVWAHLKLSWGGLNIKKQELLSTLVAVFISNNTTVSDTDDDGDDDDSVPWNR